jgi:hypothetical protein
MLIQDDKSSTTVIYIKSITLTKSTISSLKITSSHSKKNPINKDCQNIQEILQHNNLIFSKRQIKYLLHTNPPPPTLNAQLRLHKPNIPIWPVVNNKKAPTYNTAKKLNDILKQCLYLDNRYNTINSTSLAKDILKLTMNDNIRCQRSICQHAHRWNPKNYGKPASKKQWQTQN